MSTLRLLSSYHPTVLGYRWMIDVQRMLRLRNCSGATGAEIQHLPCRQVSSSHISFLAARSFESCRARMGGDGKQKQWSQAVTHILCIGGGEHFVHVLRHHVRRIRIS